MSQPFICPRCGRTSHNPTDLAEGYCGACHAWTADSWEQRYQRAWDKAMAEDRGPDTTDSNHSTR